MGVTPLYEDFYPRFINDRDQILGFDRPTMSYYGDDYARILSPIILENGVRKTVLSRSKFDFDFSMPSCISAIKGFNNKGQILANTLDINYSTSIILTPID